MDYDDRFHPIEGNDIEDYERNTNMLQNLKSMDNKYHKYKKNIFTIDDHGYKISKKIVIEYYSSGPIGSYIRNALTCLYTTDMVGSKNEDLYFKINLSYGNSATLFYETPEQYERHHHDKLSTHIKENWLKKKLIFEKNT